MSHRRRPLRVDPVEDRVVPSLTHVFGPSEFASLGDPRNDHAYFHARVDAPDRFADEPGRGRIETGDGFDFASRGPQTVVVLFFLDRPDDVKPTVQHSKSVDQPVTEPVARGPELSVTTVGPTARVTVAAAGPTPVSTSTASTASEPATPVAAAVRLAQTAAGQSFAASDSVVPGRSAGVPQVPGHTTPDTRTESPAVRAIVLGGVETPASVVSPETLPVDASDPVLPDPRPRPAESVLDRIVDVVFPDGVPFIGAVPVADVTVGASAVLDRLSNLGDPSGDAWASPERWAWMAGVVLTAGGVAASARPRRDRRPVAPGPGPDLGRWEDPIDYGST
jgi:hypothetical protein